MDPITREEMYLAAAAGYDVEPPEPITRKEVFLAKLAGMDVETPAPFTRRERFIEEAAMAESNAVIEPLQITENGTYTAPAGVDGYNPVTVDVPAPEIKLQDKTITENGEYTADSGFDGLGKVLVQLDSSASTLSYIEKHGNIFEFNNTSGAAQTVKHNLGVVPDIIILFPVYKIGTGDGLLYFIGDQNKKIFFHKTLSAVRTSGTISVYDNYGNGFTGTTNTGRDIYKTTETEFVTPNLIPNTRYFWQVIGGLPEKS